MITRDRQERPPRVKRRLVARFGIDGPDRMGFTKNLSATGVFVRTNQILRPGTVAQVELAFPDRTFTLWGRVAWAKKVPRELAHVIDCGMGFCFVDPGTEWATFYRGWAEPGA